MQFPGEWPQPFSFYALFDSQCQEISGTGIAHGCPGFFPRSRCSLKHPVRWVHQAAVPKRHCRVVRVSWLIVSCNERQRGKEREPASERRGAEEVSERKVDTIQGSIRSDTGVRGWRWRHHRWLSVEDGSVACRRGAHGRAAAVCRASAGCVRMAGGARGGVVDCSRDAQVHLMLQCSQTAELFVDVCELLLRETCHRHHFV